MDKLSADPDVSMNKHRPELSILSGHLHGRAGQANIRRQELIGPVLESFYARRGKRLLDVVIASICIAILWPVMLATAAVVLMNDGFPVIYRQPRAGKNLVPFVIVKVRTMYNNSEHKIGAWKRSDPQWKGAAAAGAAQRDPRILPGAGFLRDSSLDELPQFWNVLRGEMSIIGPRPLLCSQIEDNRDVLNDVLMRRSAVRPGITGQWQVSGRSDVSFSRMMTLDLEYIQTLSFWNDVLILIKTVAVVLRGTGAG